MAGEYDVATVGPLSAMFSSAIVSDEADLVVDMSEVSFLDAATLGVVVRASEILGARARSLRLREPSPFARRILGICGLDVLVEPAGDDHELAVPPATTGRNRPVPTRLVSSEGGVPDQVVSESQISLVDTTPARHHLPKPASVRERQ